MSNEELVKLVKDLIAKVDALVLEKQELESRVYDLETGSVGTGVYLDGCPDYAKEYISQKNTKKDGE